MADVLPPDYAAVRIYVEHERQEPARGPTTLPIGLAQSRRDAQAIRACTERGHASIVSWNRYDCGGLYEAHLEPGLLVTDIRNFCSALRP